MTYYLKEEIKYIPLDELISLMSKELNNKGFRVTFKDGDGFKEYEYDPDEYMLEGAVVRDTNALNYLKQIGLLNNGRCPRCGAIIDNTYSFTSGLNLKASFSICENCYNKGREFQMLTNPKSSSNGGCLSVALIVIILSLGVFYSCNNKPKEESLKLENKDIGKPLPSGYSWGKVEAYSGKNKIEQNIMNQTSTYSKALLRGDIDGAISFLYPDVTTYFKRYYPEEFTTEEINKELTKQSSEDAIKLTQSYINYGMSLELLVCDKPTIIDAGTALLCTFPITTQVCNEEAKGEKCFHSIPTDEDYIVGVSFNNGQNWTFFARNSDTPNILRLRFSNDVINKIMEY